MSPHILRSDQVIGQWEVPTAGTLRNVPIYKIPPEALWSSANVLVRGGFLQPRPGLTEFSATVMTGRPTGIFHSVILATGAFQTDTFQTDSFQMAGSIPSTLVIVGTTDKAYAYYGGVLNDITGSPDFTAIDTQQARFAAIALGSPQVLYVLHTNGADAPRQWDVTTGTFAAVSGSPRNWTDIANISEHIVGIFPPYDIDWGNTQSVSSWPAANRRVLSDTPDDLRAVAPLGLQSGAVYKSGSIWNVIVTGSPTESGYFRFESRGPYEGPASPGALVTTDFGHVYMADSGRIGVYDGSRHMWIGDGIWPLIQDDMDEDNTARIFGAYDPLFRVCVFVYPKTGDAGECKGWAIVQLPNPKEGYDGWITFHGTSTVALSAGSGFGHVSSNHQAFLARSTSGSEKLYTWSGEDDAGGDITGHLQTGLVAAPGLEFFTLEAYETLALRGANYGSVTVKPVSSFILNTEGGTVGSGKTLDLTESLVLGSYKGGDVKGRFFGLRYEFTKNANLTFKWLGARLSALLRKG